MKNLEPLGGGEPRQDCAEGLDKIIKEMRKLLIASWPAGPTSFPLMKRSKNLGLLRFSHKASHALTAQ